MCTAIRYGRYLGRNFDYDISYNERVMTVARNYQIRFKHRKNFIRHYAMIGMGIERDGFPLYFDAMNEKGLCAVALNFPKEAVYFEKKHSKENIASFEFIPYILSRCKDTEQVWEKLKNINITNTQFSPEMPPSPLHWIISDKTASIVTESTRGGIKLYKNKAEVLTNSPVFNIQLFNLTNYMSVTNAVANNRFSEDLKLCPYSFGMGGLGLPGDFSSMSRFVRGVFCLHNSPSFTNEKETLTHLFRIMQNCAMPKGCVMTDKDKYEYTQYTSCLDLARGEYHYTSYHDLAPKLVKLNDFDLEGSAIYTV